MQTIWEPSGKYSRLLLRQILYMRDRNLLDIDIWTEQNEDGHWVYVIDTGSDRQ